MSDNQSCFRLVASAMPRPVDGQVMLLTRFLSVDPCVLGLKNAPKAFMGLFAGENLGKQLVKVS